MVHGLPQKPQGQGVPGPSRLTAQQQHQARQPQQPRYQQPRYQQPRYQQQQQQQQQQPYYPQAGGNYPYAAQPAAGFNPYAAYYQQAAQYPYAYGYQPTATPEGYSYSATYQAAQPAYIEPPNKRSRPNEAPGPVVPNTSVKPWRNCSHPGCKYVGSGEDVEIHEGDRHLIFPNGRPVERSEEEEKWASHKGPPPPIEGTGIVLQTDEDIAKWIAERKSKWPSAKRLAERNAEREAAIARGENPDRGRGRGRGGANGGKRNNPAAAAEDWGRPAPEESLGQSSRGGMRGRGQERGRGRGRGRGRDERNMGRPQATLAVEEAKPAPTSETTTNGNDTVTTKPTSAAGLVGYNSNESADEVDVSDSELSSDSSSSSDEDEEPVKAASKPVPQPADKPDRPICKFFAKTGRCKMGQKCRFSHVTDGKPQVQETNTRAPGPKPKQVPLKRANPFERPSMLGALLANPIQNTLSQLTQTIRFLVANDMLQGVELHPGDAELQEKEKNRIEVVEEGGDVEMVQEVGTVELPAGPAEAESNVE